MKKKTKGSSENGKKQEQLSLQMAFKVNEQLRPSLLRGAIA